MRIPLFPRASVTLLSVLCVFLLCVLCDSVVSLSSLAGEPARPKADRGRVASPDVNQPIPLPILAQPVSDRVSLDDPTAAASTAAATAARIPPRTGKAPFVERTLPDPYDRRRTDVPAPEESKDFPCGSPQLPQR
jgi:hypothetical protein